MSNESKTASESWHEDMMHAFEEAASGIEEWEYGGAETRSEFEQQKRAAIEVGRRIREMAARYQRHHMT